MATAVSSTTDPVPRPDQAPHGSSHVRVRRRPRGSVARARVEEYLRALGLNEPERLEELGTEIVARCSGAEEGPEAEAAVALAQAEYESFAQRTFGPDVEPLWLRTFFTAHPEAMLAEPEVTRQIARKFGNPQHGVLPREARFHDQQFKRARVPSWFLGLLPPLVLTAGFTIPMARSLAHHGLSLPEILWLSLFALLFGLIAAGCTVAVAGGLDLLLTKRAAGASRSGAPAIASLPRTVVAMPICHEPAETVFAAIGAMSESLARTPGGESFEFFVLSDSRDPGCAAEEERAFRRIAGAEGARVPIYYRRRIHHERQKAGNLAEFFERWGKRYSYALILDADSLMSGETMVELVRRMEASPRLGLLQAPLALQSGGSLFARAQQFVTSTVGPLFTRGLALWSGPHGNYYGHNAVVRVRAFLECCALPTLSGAPPFGGHVLSHDFVEAALLCRAGWEVRTAWDLGGSYEEVPETLPAYLARDRRWFQGNLQHLRILGTEGFKPMSRIHMLQGVAAYVAGPALLLFLALGAVLPDVRFAFGQPLLSGLLVGAVGLGLLGPKLLGCAVVFRDPAGRRAHGGALHLFLSVLLEAVLAALLAPLFMVHHGCMAVSILLGRSVGWRALPSGSRNWYAALAIGQAVPTGVGIVGGALLWALAPELLIPLGPLWVPLVFSFPLAALASSDCVGTFLRRVGLLLVPTESSPDPLSQRAAHLRHLTHTDEATRFRDLVLDPFLVAFQVARARRSAGNSPGSRFDRALCERALRIGPTLLTTAERANIVQSPPMLEWLHRHAWRHWPVESWQLGRSISLLPPRPLEHGASHAA